MVVAVQVDPSVKGRPPKLSMLEIVTVANKRYKLSKLRQPIIPQGFCYVCSRLDPSGVFSNPNSHLYNKGYFHACEHFPRAPYTTFIQEDKNVPHNDISGEVAATQTSIQPEEPSVRINIRQGSRATRNPSPLKTVRTSVSSTSNVDALDSSRSAKCLPSIYYTDARAGQSLSPTNIITKSTQSCVQTGQSNRAWLLKHTAFLNQSERLSDALNVSVGNMANSMSFATYTADRFNLKPTCMMENENSILTLSKGTTFSNSSKTPFPKMTTETFPCQTENAYQRLGSRPNIPAAPYINISDGLRSTYALEPLVREVAKLESTKGSSAKILNARRQRESISHIKSNYSSITSLSSHRPESGHLRYHHRLVFESLPKHGFEIPPTPSIDTIPSEMKLHDDANEVAWVRESENDVSKDASMNSFSDNRSSNGLAMSNTPEKSFCRCASVLREISWSRNVCKTCGKSCPHSCEENTENETHDSNSTDSLSSTRKMLHQNGSLVQQNAYSDESHDGDDSYCSSNEDDSFQDLDRSPLSWQRYKHAQPYPFVDPDIHKLAYLNALHEAQTKKLQQNKHLWFDENQKLRRPNVFSYFPLLPYRSESGLAPTNLGIRPDNSVLPKTEQLMRHIFGDVKLDSFYPGRKIRDDRKIVFDNLPKSATSEKTVLSEKTEFESELFVPSDVEKAAIALKMRKLGLSVEEKKHET